MQRDPAPEEAGIVLGTGTQIQDSGSCCDGVVSLLPRPHLPASAFCREIFCVHRSHSKPGTCPCGDPDPSQQLPRLREAPKPPPEAPSEAGVPWGLRQEKEEPFYSFLSSAPPPWGMWFPLILSFLLSLG